jgi:hypothetical protein
MNREKQQLFEYIKKQGLLWSYSRDIQYSDNMDSLIIETVLKYGDFDELKQIFALYDQEIIKKIWGEKVVSDKRFIKGNYFVARIFFGMDIEADYFKGLKNARFEKLKMLAS